MRALSLVEVLGAFIAGHVGFRFQTLHRLGPAGDRTRPLNPFDYFTGNGHLAWSHGLVTLATPYGFLREKTGSVVAPATLHVLLDVVILVLR